MHLATIPGLTNGYVGSIPSVPASQATIESELVHLVVAADFDSSHGGALYKEALEFRRKHDNVELTFVHSAASLPISNGFSDNLYASFHGKEALDLATLESITWYASTAGDEAVSRSSEKDRFWSSAEPFLDAAGFKPGKAGIVINGRIVGPLPVTAAFDKNDFEALLSYERKKRLVPAALAIKEVRGTDGSLSPLEFAKYSNIIALSTVSDVPEGILDGPPPVRTCLLYTSPSPRDGLLSRMPSSA